MSPLHWNGQTSNVSKYQVSVKASLEELSKYLKMGKYFLEKNLSNQAEKKNLLNHAENVAFTQPFSF